MKTSAHLGLALAMLSAASAQSENEAMTGTATIKRDCAPWDGAAFSVTVDFPDGSKFIAHVWGKGLADFEAGKTVELRGSNSDGTGNGVSCNVSGKCASVSSSVRIPAEGIAGSGTVRGVVTIQNSVVPVTAHREQHQPAVFCG